MREDLELPQFLYICPYPQCQWKIIACRIHAECNMDPAKLDLAIAQHIKETHWPTGLTG